MKTLWVLLASAAGWAVIVPAEQLVVDGVAAYVNDAVITAGDVREAVAPLVAQLKAMYKGQELSDKIRSAYDDVLSGMIENKLIVKSFEADETLNKDAVEKMVERRLSDFIQERFKGDRQEFLKALAEDRISIEQWRAKVRDDLIVGLMRNREVDSKAVVSPADIRRVYENNALSYIRPDRVKLGVILVNGSTNEADQSRQSALVRNTLKELEEGADFGECARRVSEDDKASKGGDWGWVDTADLRRELVAGISSIPTNGLSGVIQVGNDCYILKVMDRQKAGVAPFDEVRASIERELRKKEAKRLYKVWIERLRRDAYVEITKNAKS